MVNWAWCKFCNGVKIKKGDMVLIISGKDRGKNGKIIGVFPKSNRIIVEGIALKKSHERPQKAGQKGEVVIVPSSIHSSNATLFCKNCNKNSRSRICKKCNNKIS